MGSLRNALRGKLDFYKHKHGECQNFEDGTCKAAHFTNVNPQETACPHFKAKEKTKA
jgi:hypothetical protein